MVNMTDESAMLTLDAVMRLCVFCGTALPADQVSTPADKTAGSCEHCGTLAPNRKSPEQIAELVRAAHPHQLRAERRRIIKDSAALQQEWNRVVGHYDQREREDQLWNKMVALRAAFLASIGAVPVPLTFYTLWMDTWERDAGRKAPASERSFSDSEFGEYDCAAGLYPSHYRCWLASVPFGRDEILPLFGSQLVALFLPPSVSAAFLQGSDGRNIPQLGHSSLQGLQEDGRSLRAWSLGDKPFFPTAYTDVDELRSKRLQMRTLRRDWAQAQAAPVRDSDTPATDTSELWHIEKVAEFLGCSQSRARAIMSRRGIPRISGYPAEQVRQVQRRQGARTDLANVMHDQN